MLMIIIVDLMSTFLDHLSHYNTDDCNSWFDANYSRSLFDLIFSLSLHPPPPPPLPSNPPHSQQPPRKEGKPVMTFQAHLVVPSDSCHGNMTMFPQSFSQTAAFRRWRHIGLTHQLHSDEEIACFLMKWWGMLVRVIVLHHHVVRYVSEGHCSTSCGEIC